MLTELAPWGRANSPDSANHRALPTVAWRWPGGLLLLAVAGCLLWLPYLDAPLDDDAAGYATAAYWWARGDTLYQNITITRPQGIFVVFRLILAAGLGSTRGIHLAAALTSAASLLLLAMIARRLWGEGVALGAAAAFAGLMAVPYLQGPIANAELFMLPPLLGSLYALLRASDAPRARSAQALLVASGVLGAVAALIKPSAITMLPLGLAWLAWRGRAEGAKRWAWLPRTLLFGGGFMLGLAPALAHGLLTAGETYLGAVLWYRLGHDSLVATELGFAHALAQFGGSLFVVLAGVPLILVAGLGFWAIRADREHGRRDFLILWLVTSGGGIALGGNWFPHYYQQAVPPLAIAIALGVRAAIRWSPGPRRGLLRGLTIGAIVQLAVVLGMAFASGPTDAHARLGLNHALSPSTTAAVVAYLMQHTDSDDAIYVAYQQVDLYFLTGRRPATRWMYGRELLWGADTFDEQVARLANPDRAPRYVVGVQAFDFFGGDPQGAMRAVVARDYTLEATIDGVPLYRRR